VYFLPFLVISNICIYTKSINNEIHSKNIYQHSTSLWYQSNNERPTSSLAAIFFFTFIEAFYQTPLLQIFFPMASSSTNTETHTETNPSTPNFTQTQQPAVTQLSSFAQSITKLHKENYMSWRGLAEPFLKGHDLYGFLDGTKIPPSPLVSTSPTGTVTTSTDPDTLWWHRQDQLILSMLMSSISDAMLPQVLGCKTAQELWNTLDRTFTSESQARVLNLRLQLTTAKKGNLSVSDHFHKIKHITATLAAAGHPVSDSEFTAYLLGGLGPEYDPFVTSVTTSVEPLSMDTLFWHLLAHESRIAQHNPSDSLFPTANIASRSPHPHRGRDVYKSFPHAPLDKVFDHGGVLIQTMAFLLEIREDLQVFLIIHAQISLWAFQDPAHIWALDPLVKYMEKWAIQPSLATTDLIKPTRLLAPI
jgi:hypothetical protein